MITQKKKRLAIIGSGIAGLGALYRLHDLYDITVFEREPYTGGHTNTLLVQEDHKNIPIDSGFMVFNEKTYPLLSAMLQDLDVRSANTDMSFSVQNRSADVEWSGTGFKRFFARKSNLLKPEFFRTLLNIAKFNATGSRDVDNIYFDDVSVEDYARANAIHERALEDYILPMMSSLWSASADDMRKFPVRMLLKFMQTHGLLSTYGQFQWKTIPGGASTYVEKLKRRLAPEVHLTTAVERVTLRDGSIRVRTTSGDTHDFDKCVIATHADQAAAVLDDSLSDLRNQLQKFKYQKNFVCLHTDSSIMPSTRGNWASWNYRLGKTTNSTSIHYWMNNLQPLDTSTNYFISLNSSDIVEPSSVKQELVYHHPLFTLETNRARQVLEHHNLTADSIFFCGSYFGFGFHEDALRSAYNVADSLSQPTHWSGERQNSALESRAKDGVL